MQRFTISLATILCMLLYFCGTATAQVNWRNPPPPPPQVAAVVMPLVCFNIRVTNLYHYTSFGDTHYGENFITHVLPSKEGFTPMNPISLTNNESKIIGGYVYNSSLFVGADNLIEIGIHQPDSNHPENHGRIRVELGPNLEFTDATAPRDITENIDYDHPLRHHLRLISGVDCDAVAAAGKTPSSAPPATPPSPPSRTSTPIACPHLQEIRKGVQDINRLASRLGLDDSYYQAAAEDMLAFGYSSDFARLAFSGDEASISRTLATPAMIESSKESLIANVRQKAEFRQQLATAMFAYSQGQPYQAPGQKNSGITDSVAKYLCSADPNKMDIPSWDALYYAGYIPTPFYKDVRNKMRGNQIMAPIVLAATMDLAPLAVGILRVPAAGVVAASAEEIEVLKALARKDLAFEIPRTFSTIEQRLTGKELNTLKFDHEGLYPPFLEDAPAYEASTNEPTQLVRFYRSDRANKIRGWLVRKELVIDTQGNFLPAKDIQNLLALDKPPDLVCDVTVPPNTKFWVGTAAPQPELGGIGRTEQFYLEKDAINALKFGQPVKLTK